MRKPEQPHEVLEQELETLITAGQDQGEDEVRKRMRVIKNRLSAKKSREQARDYVQKLEGSFSNLMAQHQSLARRLAMVEYENATLRHQMYYSQPSTPPQNHVDQPAVLSKSPQSDAVLALVWATMVALIGGLLLLTPGVNRTPVSGEASAPMPQALAQLAALTSPGSREPWVSVRRSVLHRVGLLEWVEHLCHSIPLPHRSCMAATAAA